MSPPFTGPLRDAITSAYRRPEPECLPPLIEAATLPAETMAVWHMLGVNVVEMYGQTETAGGIVAGQRGPFARPGDVGTIPEGIEVKLAEDGVILVRSPDLFDGYWGNREASQAMLGDGGASLE